MGSFNKKSINRKVARSKAFANSSREMVSNNLVRAKKEMIREFESHPVTKEISAGVSSSNLSNTLTGYGNLFTFIGFSSGDNPISKVRESLVSIPKIKSTKLTLNKRSYTIEVPDVSDFRPVSRMPWESGRSWLESVETGISGFSYYMAYIFDSEKSRSGGGVQTENKLRASAYRPIPYMTPILRRFVNGLSR
jgi:hypothetical protein